MPNKKTNETKLCKHCQTEIPKKAKICPNCKKKQGGIVKWIVIAVIALVIIGAASGGGKENNEPQRVSDSTPKPSEGIESSTEIESQVAGSELVESNPSNGETMFKVGETAELNGVQVTLSDYKENTGSDYNKPTDGNIFILAEFEISNNTEKELAISSMLSFNAYADDYVLNYSLGAMMENDGTQLDGTIAAGKKLKGWIGWEVPKDYQNIEIHFTDNVWSNNKFLFLIEK